MDLLHMYLNLTKKYYIKFKKVFLCVRTTHLSYKKTNIRVKNRTFFKKYKNLKVLLFNKKTFQLC